ncbi:imidazoleglycerol-phosphate dehydratase HisB [Garciella nitratireducens]|uniref:Imidazoleglycerol-phosphate dehydratase n=1 Tax=Garciella nitratireducens DSM 15102 TaxID=1121911 RepID=A0A1T4KNI3_9FIRM|nr:imidazoleglycerol-phosphate dehydratase HisB [Garciella nitratireducens]RBP40277.1 imidazoleglycerol-phosphate dehydratase [Garciella nitratireducens]SJZ43972.1 imidazoleglycerol-phosphate dehydratase [Garciella nitratireducens DSM 15102]
MRYAKINRKTTETEITLSLQIDGSGKTEIESGIGFFDHMLILFCKHGLIDLNLKCNGDLEVDGHHTVEDIGIVLGEAVKQALGKKEGILRYGTSFTPMDEALTMVSLDISGRPYLCLEVPFTREYVGNFETELLEEFLRAFVYNAGITLHVILIHGENNHHIMESIFKGLGRALDQAITVSSRIEGVLSSKGIL